jgi:RND family efflux transporter MFP subunit
MNKFMIIMERIKAALSMAGKRRASAGMLAAFLLAAVFIVGCRDKVSPGTAEVKRTPVSGVTIAEMKPSQVDDYYETSGTVKAKNVGVIASKIMGSVTSVVVREGQRVNRGQTLLTIDDSDLAQKVTAATSSVESARQQKQLADVTLSRYAKLYEEKALSRQEFDQVETQKKIAENEFERAKAMLREAQAYQGYAHIRAPFAGVVTGKKIDPGSMAMPGMQLLTVEDTSGFLVEAAVDEKLSARLRVGTPVDISIDALNQTIKGKVSEAVPAIDPMSRTFIVKVTVSGTGLKTGLFARDTYRHTRRSQSTGFLNRRKGTADRRLCGRCKGNHRVSTCSHRQALRQRCRNPLWSQPRRQDCRIRDRQGHRRRHDRRTEGRDPGEMTL